MLGIPKKELPREKPDEAASDAPTQAPEAAGPLTSQEAACDWRLVRRPARSQDLYLSTQALAWLADLPPELVPRRLAHDHPRIANRLALCWCDPVLATLVLDSLLVDRRGGRLGFAAAVEQELAALRADAQQRARPEAANQEGALPVGHGAGANGDPQRS